MMINFQTIFTSIIDSEMAFSGPPYSKIFSGGWEGGGGWSRYDPSPLKALVIYRSGKTGGWAQSFDEESLGTSIKDKMFWYTQSSCVLEMASLGCL